MTVCMSHAQDIDYDIVADRVVNQSLEVQPGEVVILYGQIQEQEIIEALYVAISKAGGQPLVRIELPDAQVRVAMETDIEYLKQPYWASAVTDRLADCVISVSSVDDPARWKDVRPEAIHAWRESNDKTRLVGAHDRQRIVTVGQTDGIPTKALADLYGADYHSMQSDFWKAMSIDHAALQKTGNTITAQLTPGAHCTVTSPNGTDIRFRFGDTAPMISCGKTTDQQTTKGSTFAWLPAGDAFIAVDPSSAAGTIAMPAYYWNNQKYTNLKIEFQNGQILKISADQSSDKLREVMLGRGVGAVPLSALNIGINPHSKVHGDYRSYEMAGMVTLCLGDNHWAGGDINHGMEYGFHLVNATLSVNGQDVVKSGELKGLAVN